VGEYGVRCVATDLDGTLVHTDGTISARTAAAIAQAEAAGIDVVLVTGRPPRWMHPVAEATGHRGLAICANGALVYDLHAERIVETFPLGVQAAADVVENLRRAVAGVAFAVERGDGFGHEPDYEPRYVMPDSVHIAPMDELLAAGPAVKILVRHKSMQVDELLAAARDAVGDAATITHSNVNDRLLEISAAGVSKASTLAALCAERGIAAGEVVAFGDMPNDLPMLEWAGLSYAVSNAHPEVLAAVDHVTASNDDDGVANVLEQLIAGR
jgi:Cof subfamily protein (haloacid dehalogenase superfamily)